ncbi:phage tail fiber C-terminal domain-containing protein [Escherichia coli]|nr:phage tail fiber C-terminal domain-containing protein [Escherichia coli]
MNILRKLMQSLCGCGKHDDCENGVVRPLQILRADGTWENIGGMK